MAKKKIQQNSKTCKDCKYAIVDIVNLSSDLNIPIFCTCKFQKYKRLLNHHWCVNFQNK